MSKSFYAVKIGRVPGVYSSWPQCKKQIDGFSKAVYKGFATKKEAEDYLGIQKPSIASLLPFNNPAMVAPLTLAVVNDPTQWAASEPYFYEPFNIYVVDERTPGFATYGKKYELYDRHLLNVKNSRVIPVYLDGSKRPSVNHRGSGAYVRYKCIDYYLSVPFTPEIGAKYGFTDAEIEKLSSPTMEYLALSEVLWRLVALKLPEKQGAVQVINPRLKLIIVADYNGVKHFSEGSWVAKETHIIKIHQFCSAIRQWLFVRGVDLEFVHVNGHAGVLGNEICDSYAKSTEAVDSIVNWVAQLSADLAKD